MAYPSVVTTYTNPNANDRLNSPSHSSIEVAQNTGLTEIQTFVGTLSSVAGTLMYDVRAAASDGGGHVQTANKGGTGQINYTKGDILVAQSASVLTKVSSTGSPDGYALITDSTQATGVKWGQPGGTPTVRVYTSSVAQTWTKPSVLSYLLVEVQAGGGNGEGTSTSANTEWGAGGGSGAYTRRIIPASSVPAAVSVLAGGASVLTYFGSLLQATGGINAAAFTGGAGGSVLVAGDISANGQKGGGGQAETAGVAQVSAGHGGDAILGNAGLGSNTNGTAGSSGTGFGAGGGGGRGNNGGDGAGGPGAPGVVIVTEI